VSGPSRRAVLSASVGALAALAGCGEPKRAEPRADASPPDTGPPDVSGSDVGPDAALSDAAAPDAGPAGVEALPLDEDRFPLGVQAGSATSAGALLWTFVAEAGAYSVHVWPEAAPEQATALPVQVPAEVDGYVRVTADALTPDTVYRYAFVFEGQAARARSVIGRFVTALAPGGRRVVRLGATACTNFSRAPYRTLELMAAERLDFFCHLGDMSYNDGAETLTAFRAKWVRTLLDPGYRALLASTGTYITWDDHEIIDGSGFAAASPELIAAGKQAFFEALPVAHREGDRFWASYRWGDTVEVFVLDSRTERRPETRETPEAEYLSAAQFAWLTQALQDSPCHFKLLLNSVPITALPPLWIFENDRWAGYAAQRRALLDFLSAQAIENVFFLSGDFHVGAVSRVDANGADARHWEVWAGPGASNGNPLQLIADNDPAQRAQIYPPEQFLYASGRHAATTLELDPAANTVRVRYVALDAAGAPEVLFDQALVWGA